MTVGVPDDQSDPVPKFSRVCENITECIDSWIGDQSEKNALHTTLKPVVIENASGENSKQIMTASHHVGTLPDVHVAAFRISQELAKRAYEISRIKIEALMSNRGVPISDEEAKLLSPENYFEFHIKLRLPCDFDHDLLKRLAAAHDAHLPRNPIQSMPDGWQKRFVNLRMCGIGRVSALLKLNACTDSLQSNGFLIDRVIREYSVSDSNVALDKGWIDKKLINEADANGQRQWGLPS